VRIGISHSVDFIWDFPIAIGKPIHFGDFWLDPPVLLPSPYHNPLLDMFQNCNTLLTSLNVRISRGLEQFHRVDLAKSALVTSAAKDDWSRAAPSAQVPSPSLDSLPANMAAEPHTGPPQAGCRLAAPPQSRVSPGRVARLGGRIVPRDNPLPTFLPGSPPRARSPPRGLRSRAVQTLVLAMCVCGLNPPTQRQGQKSAELRRDSPLRLWSPLWTIFVALYYFK
jgi:hypothetical protein